MTDIQHGLCFTWIKTKSESSGTDGSDKSMDPVDESLKIKISFLLFWMFTSGYPLRFCIDSRPSSSWRDERNKDDYSYFKKWKLNDVKNRRTNVISLILLRISRTATHAIVKKHSWDMTSDTLWRHWGLRSKLTRKIEWERRAESELGHD